MSVVWIVIPSAQRIVYNGYISIYQFCVTLGHRDQKYPQVWSVLQASQR